MRFQPRNLLQLGLSVRVFARRFNEGKEGEKEYSFSRIYILAKTQSEKLIGELKMLLVCLIQQCNLH